MKLVANGPGSVKGDLNAKARDFLRQYLHHAFDGELRRLVDSSEGRSPDRQRSKRQEPFAAQQNHQPFAFLWPVEMHSPRSRNEPVRVVVPTNARTQCRDSRKHRYRAPRLNPPTQPSRVPDRLHHLCSIPVLS
jgi:hypothetical protein